MLNTKAAVSFVDDQTVQLRVELGKVQQARQTGTIPDGFQNEQGFLFADDGTGLGRVAGRQGELFMPYDTLQASPIAGVFARTTTAGVTQAPADRVGDWVVKVNGVRVEVEAVSRKSNILDTAHVDVWDFRFATVENVFLKLASPVRDGDLVQVDFDIPAFRAVRATFDPETVISEALHVNLRGFDPDDAHKVAYLSSWNGWQVDAAAPDGGRAVAQQFDAGTDWQVIDNATGRAVLSGEIALFNPATAPNGWTQNFQGTDVWKIDFSALDDAGSYHVVVDGVGRSNDYTVGDTHWDNLFELGMSGYYHQRSGIALEEPYTDWTRPRSMHPDDGIEVRQSSVRISDTTMGYDVGKPDNFEAFAAGQVGGIVDGAWGGWHDAGDWDRRTPHLETTRKMMELWELTSDYQEIATLRLPESGDGIPDILNEALWTLEFYRRMQGDDGGVSGGVESAEHPQFGDGSWGESLAVYAYAADPWTTWEYAASAAKMANALAEYDPGAVAGWRASAERAMAWAEANIPAGAGYDYAHQTSRNLAAAELYSLTGAAKWHDLYRATTVYTGNVYDLAWNERQYEAAFVYARIDRPGVDATIRQNGIIDIQLEAELLTGIGDRGGFGNTINPWAAYGWGNSAQSMDDAADLFLRMHALTGDAKWLEEAQADAQSLLGANPLNQSYLSGLGGREPLAMLNADAIALGKAPPPGITFYGDHNIRDYEYGWYYPLMAPAIWPNPYVTPVSESFQAFDYFVPATEYTVMQGMQNTMFVTGYLAAQGMAEARRGTSGADTLVGTGGDDIILGGSGADSIWADDGNDRLSGEGSADIIRGKGGNDTLFGGTNKDSLYGGDGDDTLIGGSDEDHLSGSVGNDLLFGGSSADRLYGRTGNDTLLGGTGGDRLSGGEGDDFLVGENGDDLIYGGLGADVFLFRKGDDADRIRYFEAGPDEIRITARAGINDVDDLMGRVVLAADGLGFTLTLGAGDSVDVHAATRMTLAQIEASLDVI